MSSLREGELVLALPVGVEGLQFDGSGHGMSHCMKAVDWIIEWRRRLLFVEVKDPSSQEARGHADAKEFVEGFKSKEFMQDLVTKFRDSLLYEWACGKEIDDVSYYVIVEGVDRTLLGTQADALHRRIPVGDQVPWQRPLARSCGMFDIDSWNQAFPDLPLTRDPP